MAAWRGDVETRDVHRLFTSGASRRKAHSLPLQHDHSLVSRDASAVQHRVAVSLTSRKNTNRDRVHVGLISVTKRYPGPHSCSRNEIVSTPFLLIQVRQLGRIDDPLA